MGDDVVARSTGGTLSVDVLTEGVHSGDASGIVPSSFRIARKVLDRLEDSATGRVLPAAFHAPIPDERVGQAREAAAIMGESTIGKYPFADRTQPMISDRAEACSTQCGRRLRYRRGRLPADCRCRKRAASAHGFKLAAPTAAD